MNINNKILLKNFTSLGSVQIINYIFPLITIPYVSRIFGPDGLGIINYSIAVVSYFLLVINFGFDFTATRKIAIAKDENSIIKIYNEVTNSRLLLFLISIPVFTVFLFTIPILSKNMGISLILFINCFSAVLTPQYLFQGLQKLSFFTKFNLVRGILNTILIFTLINEKGDILLYAAIGVFSNLLIAFFWYFYLNIKLKIKFSLIKFKQCLFVLREDRFVFFSSVIYSLYTTTNIIILGYFDTESNVGYYTTAITLINIIQSIIGIPLSVALYPYISKSFSVNVDSGLDKLRRIVPLIFYLNLFIGLFIILLSPIFVVLIYGNSFRNSIFIVQLLGILPLISGLNGMMGVQTMLNLKLDKLFVKITSVAAFLSIILNLLLSYNYSYVGTAVSYILTEVYIFWSLYIALKRKGINIFYAKNFQIKEIFYFLKLIFVSKKVA